MSLEELIEKLKLNNLNTEDFLKCCTFFEEDLKGEKKYAEYLHRLFHVTAFGNVDNYVRLPKAHSLATEYLSALKDNAPSNLYFIEMIYFFHKDSLSEVMKYANKVLMLEDEDTDKTSAYSFANMIFFRQKMYKEAQMYMDEADIYTKGKNPYSIEMFHLWLTEMDIYAASGNSKRFIFCRDKLEEILLNCRDAKNYATLKQFYTFHDIFGRVMLKEQFELHTKDLLEQFRSCLSQMSSTLYLCDNYTFILMTLFDFFGDSFANSEIVTIIKPIYDTNMIPVEKIHFTKFLFEKRKLKTEEYPELFKEYINLLSEYFDVIHENKTSEIYTEIINFSMEKKFDIISAKYHYDILTGAYNRVFLSEIEESILKKGDVVIYLDLNDFKKINDTYGHETGDKQLKTFAEILIKEFEDNIVIRLGGDEFVVFTRGLPEDVLAKLDEARAEYLTHNLLKNRYGFSAGVIMAQGIMLHEAIGLADQAMYDCKKNGLPCIIREV